MLCMLWSNLCTKNTYLCILLWVLCMFVKYTQSCTDAVCLCATLCLCLYIFVLALGRESCWLLPASWQLCTEAWRHHHHSAGSSPRYIPRRAVLYCPGNDERKLRKLASLDVDCAVLDCEDGVALSKKVYKYTCDEWNAASYEWIRQGANRTHTAVWLWMFSIPSPFFRQVLGLNHWKENYLREMFKTSTFHPIMMV